MNKTLKICIGIFIWLIILAVGAGVFIGLSMTPEDWNTTMTEKPIVAPTFVMTPIITPNPTPIETPKQILYLSLVDKYMNSVRSKYDKAQFDQSYMRDSDGFELEHDSREMEYRENVCDEDGSWAVKTRSRYPAYGDMIDDENHDFLVWIDHYATIRNAHNKMAKGDKTTFEYSHYYVILETPDYGDQAYKTVQPAYGNSDNPDEITGYSGNVFILKDKTIGRLHVSGYLDRYECEEVIDYYAPILAAVVDNIE